MGPEPAELTKLLENIFRSVNIALVNELSMLCERLGIDIWEVIDAASTKPFGFMRFEPGPGMGGHPVDPSSPWAREQDFYTEFIELAGKINQNQPHFCVERIEHALNDAAKPVRGSRSCCWGSPQGGRRRHSRVARSGSSRCSPTAAPRSSITTPTSLRCPSSSSTPSSSMTKCAVPTWSASSPRIPRWTTRVVAEAPLVLDFRGVTRQQRPQRGEAVMA